MSLLTSLQTLLSTDSRTPEPIRAFADSVIKPKLLEPTLQAFFPLWSLTDVRAEVVDAVMETADTRSFILRPNSLWQGGVPGQFIPVTVEINGRQVTRHYSLSRIAGGLLQIAVKKQGRVSDHLHENVQIGDVLTIGQAAGDFIWTETEVEGPVLLIAGGSGITAVMGVLQRLLTDSDRPVTLLCCNKNEPDVIFAERLKELSETYPSLTVKTHFSDSEGFLDAGSLQAKTGDAANHAVTYLCGPAGLMEMVTRHYREAGLGERLIQEAFTASPIRQPVALGEAVTVSLVKKQVQFQTTEQRNLLELMEAQGLNPKYGCRMGICGSCQCTKQSGATVNLLNGEVSTTPGEIIRPCITAACSDLEIEL